MENFKRIFGSSQSTKPPPSLPPFSSSSSSPPTSGSTLSAGSVEHHRTGQTFHHFHGLPVVCWHPLVTTCSQHGLAEQLAFRHLYVRNVPIGLSPELKALTGMLRDEREKPAQSYIGLIATAILESKEKRLLLGDIYKWVLKNYPYFRSRGSGWRNSIRHNLSLNDCFVKAGRSASGKGHYWSVHKANVADFSRGDFRRKKALRKAKRAMLKMVAQEIGRKERNPTEQGLFEAQALVEPWEGAGEKKPSPVRGQVLLSKGKSFDVRTILGID